MSEQKLLPIEYLKMTAKVILGPQTISIPVSDVLDINEIEDIVKEETSHQHVLWEIQDAVYQWFTDEIKIYVE